MRGKLIFLATALLTLAGLARADHPAIYQPKAEQLHLSPVHTVPGHGRVCDVAKARQDTGDYGDFLANMNRAFVELESAP